jgi:hypothetical protein
VSSVVAPPVRQVDPRGQRFGAGVSAIVVIVFQFARLFRRADRLVGPFVGPPISCRDR